MAPIGVGIIADRIISEALMGSLVEPQMNGRIETLEVLIENLAGALLDPKEKTAELRNAKRAEAHKTLLEAASALAAIAYASEAYLALLQPKNQTEDENSTIDAPVSADSAI